MQMTPAAVRSLLTFLLSPRYGAGEAAFIARMVVEDVFFSKTNAERLLTEAEIHHFEKIKNRLLIGEPVQYVLGEADFFGYKFRVNPAVLIPRQETEELVAWVLEYLKNTALKQPALLDIGVGSGCIGITLKKKNPSLQLFGLEKSPAALAIATENARRILGESKGSGFREGDILDRSDWDQFPLLDVVVSNPPYIPYSEKNVMPEHVLAHEPALALFVENEDPLLFYRVIANFCLEKLWPGGALFFECNEFNANEVADLLRQKNFREIELRKDLAGAPRMVKGIRAD